MATNNEIVDTLEEVIALAEALEARVVALEAVNPVTPLEVPSNG